MKRINLEVSDLELEGIIKVCRDILGDNTEKIRKTHIDVSIKNLAQMLLVSIDKETKEEPKNSLENDLLEMKSDLSKEYQSSNSFNTSGEDYYDGKMEGLDYASEKLHDILKKHNIIKGMQL